MNITERKMLALLVEGKARYGIDAVKAEFEAEGTRSDELLRLLEIARRAGVKVGLKIGGCEAMRDLIEARQFGVDYVIAPMVETPYALSKYIAAKDRIFSVDEQQDIGFLFNVETMSTYLHLKVMGEMAQAGGVGMVLGRVDFAGSLGKDRSYVNAPAMIDKAQRIAEVAHARGLDLVVGGGVNKDSIEPLRAIRSIKLDRFETRKVIFDAQCLEKDGVEAGMALAIEFELLWLKNKRDHYQGIGAEDEARIAMMEARSKGTVTARPIKLVANG